MQQAERRKLLAKAHTLGFEYERIYRGCAQCTIAAIQDTLNIRDDSVFKAANGFAAGGGRTGIGNCGGYIGGILCIGQLSGRGRDKFEIKDNSRFRCYDLSKQFTEI